MKPRLAVKARGTVVNAVGNLVSQKWGCAGYYDAISVSFLAPPQAGWCGSRRLVSEAANAFSSWSRSTALRLKA